MSMMDLQQNHGKQVYIHPPDARIRGVTESLIFRTKVNQLERLF